MEQAGHQLSFSNVNKCQKMFKCLNFRARNGHIIYVDFWRENSNVYNSESFPFCLNICSTLSRFPLLRVFVLHRGKRERKSHPRSKSLLLTEFSAATFHSRASICSELQFWTNQLSFQPLIPSRTISSLGNVSCHCLLSMPYVILKEG